MTIWAPLKSAPRAELPVPFEAPNELFSNWAPAKSADVAVTESKTVTSNMAPANRASVRSTPFSNTSLRLASSKMAPVSRVGVLPLASKFWQASTAEVKSAWLRLTPAKVMPGHAFQLSPVRSQRKQSLPAFRVATSLVFACAPVRRAAPATGVGRIGRKKIRMGSAVPSPACGCTKRSLCSPENMTVASPELASTRAISFSESSRAITVGGSSN